MVKRQSGFNLIEAAIVLGVIGLVIGGIWVAAASVSRNFKLAETAKGAISALSSIRQMYQGQACPGATVDLNPMTVPVGIPSSWPNALPVSGVWSSMSPLGTNISFQIQCGGAFGDAIIISFGTGMDNATYDDCVNLIPRLGLKRSASVEQPNPEGDFLGMGGMGYCTTSGRFSFIWSYR